MEIPKELIGDRVIVSLLKEDDNDVFFSFLYDNEMLRFKQTLLKELQSTSPRELLDEVINSYDSNNPAYIFVISNKLTNEKYGVCGLIKYDNNYECFVSLIYKYQNYGYATESLFLILDFAFNNLNISNIVSFLSQKNPKLGEL